MKVVILAGGFGSRISEKTHSIPKPMIEIGGKPIIMHIIERYIRYGYTDFLIALGYKGEIVKQYFANYHLIILTEPDYANAYIWYSIAAAINLPETSDARDDAESQIDSKNLVELQMKTQSIFDKYKFKPLPATGKGGKNAS